MVAWLSNPALDFFGLSNTEPSQIQISKLLAGWFHERTQDDTIVFTMFIISDTIQVR